jgi:hypothetical protein
MTISSQPAWSSQNVRALACLILVFSFLFNPYAMARITSGSLDVAHPASHRATVGSSELEKYSPLDRQDGHWVAVVGLAQSTSFSQIALPFFPVPPGPELLAAHPLFCASLWFRPPPAQ